MKIFASAGTGNGDTTLAAFDAALKDAGISNFNLIKLSSIVPPNSEILEQKYQPKNDEFGNKLYVVLAEERTDLIGRSIAAGIGWYQWEDNRGVFAEHHDIVETLDHKEAARNVQKKLEATVKNLCEFRNIEFDQKNLKTLISSKAVESKPTCTLVAAVFQSKPW